MDTYLPAAGACCTVAASYLFASLFPRPHKRNPFPGADGCTCESSYCIQNKYGLWRRPKIPVLHCPLAAQLDSFRSFRSYPQTRRQVVEERIANQLHSNDKNGTVLYL